MPAPRFLVPANPRLSRRFLRARAGRAESAPGATVPRRFPVCWARHALYHGLAALGVGPGSHVLMPAYICRVAVEPVIALGAEVEFYGIARDGRPDLDDIESRAQARTRALVLVHYFGFPQQSEGLRALCARRGISLVEDCAHVLRSEGAGLEMGRIGDIAVYSWAKFLPVPDGGELVLNDPDRQLGVRWEVEGLLLTLRSVQGVLDELVAGSTGPARTLYRWLQAPKRLLRRPMEAAALPGDPDEGFEARTANFPASRVSRWIAAHSDTAAIAAKRRENYLFLLEAVSGLAGVTPLLPTLPAGVCPWVFPVFFDNLPEGHRRLRERGIPAASWDGVRPPSVPRGVYPAADFLYDRAVFLPVHQSLEPEHLRLIVEGVREVRPRAGEEASGGRGARPRTS
ncbi:MAG TPA: DegT/DnrJ/EryC1/StrS family aminotransferase [Methylomirabilota bacterium]